MKKLSTVGCAAILSLSGFTVFAQYGNAPTADQTYTPNFSDVNENIIDISWEGVTSLSPGKTEGAYMTASDGKKYELFYLEGDNYSKANLRIVDNLLRLNLTNNYPNLPGGDYELFIPQGYVKFNGGNTVNDAIDGYKFTYLSPWTEGVVEYAGPDANDIITIKWLTATQVVKNPEFKGDQGINGPYLFDNTTPEGNQMNLPADRYKLEGTVFTVDITGLIMTNGSCRLLIPEGYFLVTNNNETNLSSGIYYDFTYEGADEPLPEIPEYTLYDGLPTWSIKSGDKITPEDNPIELSWAQTKISFVENPEDQINLYGAMVGYKTLAYGSEVTISEDATKLLINLGNLPNDTYRLNIPEGCLYIEADGTTYINQAVSIENLIIDNEAGIESVKSENGNYKVFNLHGVKVIETKNVSDLHSLPEGIYVINGVKVRKR